MGIVALQAECGQGAALIVLAEHGVDEESVAPLIQPLSQRFRVLRIVAPRVGEKNWDAITESVVELMNVMGIRQASFVGVAHAGSVVQHFALLHLKRVRRIVLVNGRTRPHPTWCTRAIDWIESRLPLGLPLRTPRGSFDSKSFLHQIRCPCLIVLTADAGAELVSQGELLAAHLPTAWLVRLEPGQGASRLAELIDEFQDVAAKKPRKNIGNG